MKNEITAPKTDDIAAEIDLSTEQLDEVAGGRMRTGYETSTKTSSATKCCW